VELFGVYAKDREPDEAFGDFSNRRSLLVGA
jgi:hypothetical protein